MEIEKRNPKIFIISGKARHGKDTTAMYMNEIYTKKGKKILNISYASYIKEYAKKINCKRVKFTGFQDPRPYYEKADILTMASNSEGFGMVLVEAQQYGCVPIALDSFSAVHDIIENGRNGVLVEDNNREKYGKELLELIRKEDIRRTIAKNALQDCKKFSVKNIVDQWENLFREVVTE